MENVYQRRREIRYLLPDVAIETCRGVIYLAIARTFDLSSRVAAGTGNWEDLIQDLGQMTLRFRLSEGMRSARA